MRLTLRTLLAYLDDVLEPAETKEIGQKIQESPMAATLVSRIREVMRRRRLNAPDLDGPGIGIDPNLVAQYLDNSLPPEAVAGIERVFLESDHQLAEVAACHQILTLALGEPVEILPATRERMYVLGPVEATDQLHAAGEPTHRANGTKSLTPMFLSTVPAAPPANSSFEESLPDYLRPKPWSGKILSIAIGAVVFIIWITAVISDQSWIKGVMGLKPTNNAALVKSDPVTSADDMEADQEPDQPGEVAKVPPADPAAPIEPDKKIVEAADDPPADAATAEKVPAEPVASKPVEPPASNADEAPALVAPTIQYASTEGILLRTSLNEGSWYVVPRRAELKPGALLAGPEPFESVLEIDGGAVRITLLGDTVIQILGPTKEASWGIGLVSGQLVLQSNGQGDKPAKLTLALGPRTGQLELGPGETVCGIEFLLKEPEGFEQPVPVMQRQNGVYVIAGAARWAADGEPARTADKGVYFNLLNDQAPVNFGATAGLFPDWLDPQRRKMNSTLRRSASLFEKEFDVDQPIDSSLVALIRDSRSRISELAVRSLLLTDNIPAAVQALAQSPQEETRKAAAIGLQRWLGVSAERGAPLRQALSKHYERVDDVNALYRLLWGFSVEEVKQEQPSLDLVEMLRSNHVAIRELAFANLIRLTNRKFEYRPLASPQQREPAIRRWLDFVQRDGALVKEE